MTVYIRTAAGTAAALNPLAKLPRNLRQLLVAIDGSTPSSSFAARMAGQGDIDVLFDVLQRAGLIRHTGPAGPQHSDAAAKLASVQSVARAPVVALAASPSRAPEVIPAPAPLLDVVNHPAPVTTTDTAAHIAQTDATLQPLAVVSAVAVDRFADFGAETAPASLRPTEAIHYELSNVISLMSDFVTQHLPERSLEIVLELESLSSVEQVVSSLDDYRTLITPTGEVAHHHLAELQRMLDAA